MGRILTIANKIINEFKMINFKNLSIPNDRSLTQDFQLSSNQSNEEIPYRPAVDSLLYMIYLRKNETR